jgi:hypothetical protein
MSLTSAPASVQAILALQAAVAVLASLVFTVTAGLALLLFFRRRSRHSQGKASPRGTFAFLSIGVLCLAIAQAATAASVAQQTNSSSPASITHAFSLHYRGSISNSPGETSTTSVNLSNLNAFAFIVSTVCLNAAVWFHASHATNHGLAVGQPSRMDILGNTLLLLSMAATGFASWGLAMSSYTANERYGNVLQDDTLSRVVYTVFRACVVMSTISVAVESIRRYVQIGNHSSHDVSTNTFITGLFGPPLTPRLPGIRTSHPLSPCLACRTSPPPTQRFHHPRHCSPLSSQYLSQLEYHDARSHFVLTHHLQPLRRSLGVRCCVLGWLADVKTEQRTGRRAWDAHVVGVW